MSPELSVLLLTALTLGVGHTAVGLDHTLPFVLLGRARSWSLTRTLFVATFCGVAHVISSVVIGLLGVSLVVGLSTLSWFEAVRGNWAAWGLVAFGVAYATKAVWDLRTRSPHQHVHIHADGTLHRHMHRHVHRHGGVLEAFHAHPHPHPASKHSQRSVALALLVVFLLGPCEALLPLMTAPSLIGDLSASLLVALTFGIATLVTMNGIIALGWLGLRSGWLARLEPHMNWVAGVCIALSGVGIQLGGW